MRDQRAQVYEAELAAKKVQRKALNPSPTVPMAGGAIHVKTGRDGARTCGSTPVWRRAREQAATTARTLDEQKFGARIDVQQET